MNDNTHMQMGPMSFGPVTAEDMGIWATALRDPNPIHFDAEIVKARGLGDAPIVQGTVGIACLMTLLETQRPNMHMSGLMVRLTGVAFQGETLEASADIVEETAEHLSCRFTVRAVGRGDILAGEAEMRA